MNTPGRDHEQHLKELLAGDCTPLQAAEALWYDRLWFDACSRAARAGSTWLFDEPSDQESLLEQVRRLLAEYVPHALPAMQAILHAARAAHCLAHQSGLRVVHHRVLAALAWAGSGRPEDLVWPEESGGSWPELPDDAGPTVTDSLSSANPHLPWDQVDDLVRVLRSDPPESARSSTTPVISDAADGHVIRLYLTAVEDSAERALPEAFFATLLRDASRTTAQIARAFSWARAREGFPRGTGLRWQLLGHNGQLISDCLPIDAGAAAAVGLTWMFLPRTRRVSRQDPTAVVHAALAPNGLLVPAPPPEQLSLPSSTPLVVAIGHRPAAAPSAPSSAGDRMIRPRRDVADAWKATRRPKGRRTAVISLLTALMLTAAAGLGWNWLQSSQDNKNHQAADDLASAALQTGPDSPADALRRALAASVLDPDNPRAQQALLAASRSETDLSRIVPTRLPRLRQLALSADGRYLAAVGADRNLHLWDTQQVEDVTPAHPPHAVNAMTFAPKGHLLAVSSEAGLQMWDASTGTATRTLDGAESAVSLAFDSEAQSLAAGTTDGKVLLWRKAERPGEKPLVLGRRPSPVRSVCFSSASTLAVTGTDKTVTVWSANAPSSPSHVAKLVSAGSSVMCVSKGRIVAVDRSKLYFLSPTLTELRKPVQLVLDPGAVYRPGTDSVLVALANGVKEISVDTLTSLDEESDALGGGTFYAANSHPGNIAAASSDGDTVAVPTSEGDIRIYRGPKPTGATDRRLWSALAVYPLDHRDRVLVVGGGIWGPGQLTLTDSRTGKVLAYRALGDRVRNTGGQPTAFSQNHNLVATPTNTKGILLTNIGKNGIGEPFPLPRPSVPANASSQTRNEILTPVGAAFDDERNLLFAFWGRSVITYKISGGAAPKEVSRTSVRTSLGGMVLSDDGTLLLADTNRGQEAHIIDARGRVKASSEQISTRPALLLTPGPGQSLFTASITGQVFRYTRNAQTGTWSEYPMHGHESLPVLLRVDGKLVISAGQDYTLRLARADSGQELGEVRMPFLVPTAEWAGQGTLHILSNFDERFSVPVSVQAQRRLACALLGNAAPSTIAEAWADADTSRSTAVCRSS
ncbi:WD40 repeat domain-containing protein [Streptomyces sp. NPDC004539]|uniref:WD40 repeat domain-containing protein n=1 Tax=Streptomyces sp. NPDC004539 TaxID=3154280 RepID=UPI0033A8EBCF